MIEKFEQKHERNLEKINGILISIDEYLDLMQNAWNYRILSLRTPAIKSWKENFINCKKYLIQSFDGIVFSIISLNNSILTNGDF